jgi:hypothetical protein
MLGAGAFAVSMGFAIFLTVGCEDTQAAENRFTEWTPVSAEERATVAFRAKASALPGGAQVVQGKAPDEIVEIVLPGRVYDPPLKVGLVTTRYDADRRTPEDASASDFSAMRAGDSGWLRENYVAEEYPQIKALVDDPNIRRMNQGVFMRYGVKTIVARCVYKDVTLVFARYDDAKPGGMVEVYKKVRDDWKRTNALAKDETVAVLQRAFRNGDVVQVGQSGTPGSPGVPPPAE